MQMNDTFEAFFAEWSRISDALHHSFFYDNLWPIEEIEREFVCVLIDIRQWCSLSEKASKKPLSAREKTKHDRLFPKKSAEKIEKLIDKLEALSSVSDDDNHQINQVIEKLKKSDRRVQWHQDQQQAKVEALTGAVTLCRSVLKEIRSICADDDFQK